ncbi:hypothetical protein [Paraburkholderia caribensis]
MEAALCSSEYLVVVGGNSAVCTRIVEFQGEDRLEGITLKRRGEI